MRRGLGLAISIAAATSIGSTLIGSGTASAQSLEFLHSQRVEGGRVCFNDHFHSGSSSGQATRAAAEKAAVSNWSSFTVLEYGDRWGSWRIAASKSMSCSNAIGSWGCQVDARPCRPNVGGTGGGSRRARPAKKQ